MTAFTLLPRRIGGYERPPVEFKIIERPVGGFELHFLFPEGRHLRVAGRVEAGFEVYPRVFRTEERAVAFAHRRF